MKIVPFRAIEASHVSVLVTAQRAALLDSTAVSRGGSVEESTIFMPFEQIAQLKAACENKLPSRGIAI